MNGDDVAVLRNDLSHVAGLLQEFKTDLRAVRTAQEERLNNVEQTMVAILTWKEGHEGDHERISRKLSNLDAVPTIVLRMEGDMKGLKDDMRKYSIAMGGIVAAFVTAIGQVVVAVLKLV
jgi:hypothetical protein